MDGKCENALLMLGDLELKNDDWVKAKETFRQARDLVHGSGNDSYASLCLVIIVLVFYISFILLCIFSLQQLVCLLIYL